MTDPIAGVPIALIAGEGALPEAIARKLAEAGEAPLVLAVRDDLEALAPFARRLVRLRWPSLGRGVREMRRFGAGRVIMAGWIPKRVIYFLPLLFDRLSRSVLAGSLMDDHSLLGAVVRALEREGFSVIPYWQILPEYLAAEGRLAARDPTGAEARDVECGRQVLRVTLPCSFGQAVEAMEGTDAMIARAGTLAGRGVVVKMMRRDQDLRYDLPTVGPDTIEGMRRAGLTCLAVEAGRTLILDPDRALSMAGRYGIAVQGIAP